MITAIIQIRCSRDLIPQTAEAVAELPGIAEVWSVSGEWDLMAVLKVKQYDEVAQTVTERMVGIPGVVRTNTISAFRVYPGRHRAADA